MSVIGQLLAGGKKAWPVRLFRDGAINVRLVLLGVAGIVLLLAGSLFDAAPKQAAPPAPAETGRSAPAVSRSYEEALEAKLANALSQVRGAGAVVVNITLENGSVQEFAKNVVKENRTVQEKDTAGGVRTTTETKESEQVLVGKENGVDRPVMVREFKPVVRGVLVIAEGAHDSAVKASLTRAVEAGLGIAPYKISVLPQRR